MAGLAACASGEPRYPSLALRPFETAPPATTPSSPAEATRPLASPAALAQLAARAIAADAAFTSQQPTASRLARAAYRQPVESDARARALVAMADLAAQRAATSAVLAELDQLAADSAISFAPGQEIEATRSRVLTLVQAQDAAMARLWEEMGQ
ncbi:hypothetical protein [Erythrobacter tepidarius]|uniref:hypothetical protein n=1 Tax=Erythrobacter tepidarius TaxID=60454 RepID=UPI0011803346|nr:hypothetical protein [Erythrobacter tepidarius]